MLRRFAAAVYCLLALVGGGMHPQWWEPRGPVVVEGPHGGLAHVAHSGCAHESDRCVFCKYLAQAHARLVPAEVRPLLLVQRSTAPSSLGSAVQDLRCYEARAPPRLWGRF